MMYVDSITMRTKTYNQLILITEEVRRIAAESGIKTA